LKGPRSARLPVGQPAHAEVFQAHTGPKPGAVTSNGSTETTPGHAGCADGGPGDQGLSGLTLGIEGLLGLGSPWTGITVRGLTML